MLVLGVSGLVVFYLSVMAIGIWAGSKRVEDRASGADFQGALLAGRALPFPVVVLSMLATSIGAEALLGGIPEAVYSKGVLWCHIPVGYCLSYLIGALFFAAPMRKEEHETMVDPLQQIYGPRVGALVSAPAVVSDIFRSAAVLSSLGSAMGVVLDMSWTLSVVGTAVFAAIYTMLGGLYSVAYTDAAQVSFVTLGLVLSTPFASANLSSALGAVDWLGTVDPGAPGQGPWLWLDVLLLFALGGIPSQSYMQLVLSARDPGAARLQSFAASASCLVLAVPSIAMGVIAKGADWESLLNKNLTDAETAHSALPLVVRFMTPEWVSFIGLGAVSAAVMSSVDSRYLAAASIISKNIYRVILRPKAPDDEVLWVLRCGVVGAAAATAALALCTQTITQLSLLCADLVYVVVFPQLLLSLHWRRGANSYGAVFSFLVGATLRLLAGDPGLGLPVLLRFPLFDPSAGAPHRSAAMVTALAAHVAASAVAQALLRPGGPLGTRWDILRCFPEVKPRDQEPLPMVKVRVRFSDDPDQDLEEEQQ